MRITFHGGLLLAALSAAAEARSLMQNSSRLEDSLEAFLAQTDAELGVSKPNQVMAGLG